MLAQSRTPSVVSLDRYRRAGVYLLLSVAFLFPFLRNPVACPFGLHDWAFPCFDAQRTHLLGFYLSPWFERNLGQIDPLPHANPVLAVLYMIASLSPTIALRGFLFLVVLFAGIGADIAAREAFLVESRPARLAAGITYMASPFLATKLASGHLLFLLDAAVLPFAIVAYTKARDGNPRWWAICGLCIGGLLANPQLAAMYLALLPLLSIGNNTRPAVWIGLWLLAAAIEAPLIFTSLISYHSGELTNELQLHEWFANESVPWQHALDATTYFNNYYLAIAGPATVAAWQWLGALFFLVAIVGGGVLRKLAVGAFFFGLLASGIHGPLGTPVGMLMVRFPPLLLFRELYDLLGLAPLVMAGGCAKAVEFVLQPVRSPLAQRSVAAAIVTVLVIFAWPVVQGGAARLVPLTNVARWQSGIDTVVALPDTARALWLPAIVPLGPAGSPGGADPFELEIGDHPSAQSYHPTGIFAYAAALADERGDLPPNLARRLGIGVVVSRPGVVVDALKNKAHAIGGPLAPPARPPQLISGAGPLALAHGTPACEPALRSEMEDDFAYVRCTNMEPTFVPKENAWTSPDDPTRGWVDGERWIALSSQLANPRWPVLFTLSRKPYLLSLARPGVLLAYAPNGLELDGERIIGARRWQRVMLTEGNHTAQPVTGLCAISAVLPETDNSSIATAAIETELGAMLSDRIGGNYRGWLPPHPLSLLVLREGWSPYWRAYVDGALVGSPLTADGFANGWLLPPSRHRSLLEVRNALLPTYIALCTMSLIVWVALIAVAAGVKRAWSYRYNKL